MADQLIQLARGEPRFRHDVKPSRDHRYAGSFVAITGGKAKVNDVWLSYNTIVIRDGNEGPDYAAWPRSSAEAFEEMGETHHLPIFEELIFALQMIRERRVSRFARPSADHSRQRTESGAELLAQIYDEDATGVVSFWLVPEYTTEENIRSEFRETYCQHSHDCCGHWYYNRAQVRRLPNGKAIVRQRGYVNI